jgi:hypothetical protein
VPGTNKLVRLNDQIRFFPLTVEMIWKDYEARYNYSLDESSLSQYLCLSQKVQPAAIMLENPEFMKKMLKYLMEEYIRSGARSICDDKHGAYGTEFDAGKLITDSNIRYPLFDYVVVCGYTYYVTAHMA